MGTWVLKDLRTKYCRQTHTCIKEFDHYCIWLNRTIGRGNHRQFVVHTTIEVLTQLCHLYLILTILRPAPEKFTFQMGNMIMAHVFTAPWMLMLVIQQLLNIGSNLTLNEKINLARYKHFWRDKITSDPAESPDKVYRNPFHKGSVWLNYVDFWWTRE